MPTPKKRTSRAKRDMRRSHDAIEPRTTQTCPTTGELERPHRAHRSKDGSYYFKGKQISLPKFESDETAEA